MNKPCELKPITKEQAYRALRELALRMDLTCKPASECQGLTELQEEYKWQFALDKVLGAVDLLK